MAMVAVSKGKLLRRGPRSEDDGGANGDTIVVQESTAVKREKQPESQGVGGNKKRQRRKSRRQSHGSAWHWQQTDSWYYTLPGAKKRVPLFDEDGNRIR